MITRKRSPIFKRKVPLYMAGTAAGGRQPHETSRGASNRGSKEDISQRYLFSQSLKILLQLVQQIFRLGGKKEKAGAPGGGARRATTAQRARPGRRDRASPPRFARQCGGSRRKAAQKPAPAPRRRSSTCAHQLREVPGARRVGGCHGLGSAPRPTARLPGLGTAGRAGPGRAGERPARCSAAPQTGRLGRSPAPSSEGSGWIVGYHLAVVFLYFPNKS